MRRERRQAGGSTDGGFGKGLACLSVFIAGHLRVASPPAVSAGDDLPEGWPYVRSIAPGPPAGGAVQRTAATPARTPRKPDGGSPPKAADPVRPFDLTDEAWWTVFHDPELDRLEQVALAANQNLQRAGSKVTRSRLRARMAAADFFPHLDVNIQGERMVHSDNGTIIRDSPYRGGPGEIMTIQTRSSTQNVFEAVARLNWEIDVFDCIRAAYASRLARMGVTTADTRGVRPSLTADLARGAPPTASRFSYAPAAALVFRGH